MSNDNQLYRFIKYDPANPPKVGRHWCRVFNKPERLFFGNDGKWTMPYGSIPIEAEIEYLSPVSIEPESGVDGLIKTLEDIRDSHPHDEDAHRYTSNNCVVCMAEKALSKYKALSSLEPVEDNAYAVGFLEWANENYNWVERNTWDGDNDETFTTAELYNLYKQSK